MYIHTCMHVHTKTCIRRQAGRHTEFITFQSKCAQSPMTSYTRVYKACIYEAYVCIYEAYGQLLLTSISFHCIVTNISFHCMLTNISFNCMVTNIRFHCMVTNISFLLYFILYACVYRNIRSCWKATSCVHATMQKHICMHAYYT